MREYAETTQQYVDEETAHIIATRYQKVLDLLRSKQQLLDEVARKLLAEEVLDGKEFVRIAGEHAAKPFSPVPTGT